MATTGATATGTCTTIAVTQRLAAITADAKAVKQTSDACRFARFHESATTLSSASVHAWFTTTLIDEAATWVKCAG
jgi:hypothetical protein